MKKDDLVEYTQTLQSEISGLKMQNEIIRDQNLLASEYLRQRGILEFISRSEQITHTIRNQTDPFSVEIAPLVGNQNEAYSKFIYYFTIYCFYFIVAC